MSTHRKLRIGRLDTVGHAASELARVYRAMRRGELSSQDGVRLASVLTAIRQALEVASVERRVDQLEKQAETRRSAPLLTVVKREPV